MGSVRKFLDLSWADHWVLLQAVIALPVSACTLNWFGMSRCRAFFERTIRRPTEAEQSDSTLDEARRIARLVRIAATRSLYAANCLQRSIVLWWLLRRRGVTSDIRFGCRVGENGWEAHAWVECRDQVIGDSADVRERFAPFVSTLNDVQDFS